MRLQIESIDARDDRLAIWHRWFAWYPVRLGPHDVRWMETVERRLEWQRTLGGTRYLIREYRLPDDQSQANEEYRDYDGH